MVVAIFRSRVKAEKLSQYYAGIDEMTAIAKSMPGHISHKSYSSPDGERISIREWESKGHLEASRTHPAHFKLQSHGREHFYEEHTLYVCAEPWESRFDNGEQS